MCRTSRAPSRSSDGTAGGCGAGTQNGSNPRRVRHRARALRDFARLAATFAAHPRQVGALVPTSRRTVQEMLDMTDLRRARLVVELGAGTGAYTGELLRRIGPT